MIGACDCCDRQEVPLSHLNMDGIGGCESFVCYICQGETDPDPYCEVEMNAIERLETSYKFECEAGPLRNCVEWKTLKDGIASAVVALEKTKAEFNAAGKPAGYVGMAYVDAALSALGGL